MDLVRQRVTWAVRMLLTALVIYVVGGIMMSVLIFGSGGPPGTVDTVYAIASGVAALTAAVLLTAYDIRLSDMNWASEAWMLERPPLAIAITSVASAFFFVGLGRDVGAAPAGAGLGIILGSIGLRRSRERHGCPPPASTDPSIEARVENWRFRRPVESTAIVVVVCFGLLSLADRGLITVPANVVGSLILGWFNFRHTRKFAEPQPPPPVQ